MIAVQKPEIIRDKRKKQRLYKTRIPRMPTALKNYPLSENSASIERERESINILS